MSNSQVQSQLSEIPEKSYFLQDSNKSNQILDTNQLVSQFLQYDSHQPKQEGKKATKVDNHQTISSASTRHGKKRYIVNKPVNNIQLKPPQIVFFNNVKTNQIEQMDIEQLCQAVKEHYQDDAEYLDPLPPEDDKHGNIEYKLKLIKTEERRLQELECQMLRRLDEGVDECYYWIGVEDNGNTLGLIEEEFFLSLKILSHVANKNECYFQLDRVYNGERGRIGFVKIKQRPRSVVRADIRIQLMGQTGSGKTTLIKTMYYKESGCQINNEQTTQIQQRYLCFDSQGKLLSRFPFTVLGIEGEIELATKIISFVDIGGKQKDRKYFVLSYCSRIPNYGLIVISAKNEFSESDKTYIRDAVSMGLVFFIVITNTDNAPSSQIGSLICEIKNFIYSTYAQKYVQVIYNISQVAKIFTESFLQGNFVPIFLVSSKTLSNIKLFSKFLSQLPDNRRVNQTNKQELTELTIYNALERSAINVDKSNNNVIFQGTVLQGELHLAQNLLIGPDINGLFKKVKVQELMVVKTSVERVQTSQICSVRVSMDMQDKKKFEVRKGQVLVDPRLLPRAASEFLAELTLFDSIKEKVLIKTGYQPVVNFQSIRQICKIMVTKEDLEGKGYRPLARRKSLEREMNHYSDQHLHEINFNNQIKAIKSSTQGDKQKEEKALVFSKNLNKKFLRRTKSIDKIKELFPNDQALDQTSQKIEIAQDNVPVIVIEPSKNKQNVNNQLNKYQPEVKNYLRMRFIYRPERIQVGQMFYIDEKLLKAVGVVTKVFY
ncbi:elongation factor Tu GTP-binding domain protein (macronuclear) [Tetrahymena thermophila SB210]|uniref:Elongation factor Tu GTP-binding domain protein n=1 Tax=Tetrahymena thermophila (strain SB210) TaxID=312017 RepID=Q23R23_TETTS|nr:elongation factor Tu GTP-binding domain protein [Tetrahymena thermophila SB210]EAR99018.2 elongation factor Tu GTP-binding domain protein [Tetrahymena thermophila SB210]|eukprot:XP_001019263.2 elongation factor Tu GTP-binding domain protein [Tetrahymena thermophila SB210]